MKTKMFTLFAAALVMVSQAAVAADAQTGRSVGAHPVVYDDYPESSLVLNAGGDIVLTITGEARTRFEWVENNTDFSSSGYVGVDDSDDWDDNYSFAPARFKLGFRFDMPRDVAAVIELQKGFEFGGGYNGDGAYQRNNINQHLRPNRLNAGPLPDDDVYDSNSNHVTDIRSDSGYDNGGIDIYQAYIETANIGGSLLSMRFGRQEFAYGTEFLLGNQDWYDGQAWDGVKGIFEFNDANRLDLFWAKMAERDTSGNFNSTYNQGGNDNDLFGAYFSSQSLGGSSVGMDAYILSQHELANDVAHFYADPDDPTSFFSHVDSDEGAGHSFMESYWVGVRFFREREHGFHFSAELTYQFGEFDADGDNGSDDFAKLDISAWAFEGFLGYTWNTPTNPTLHGGVTYATGSDINDYARGDYGTFFTPGGEIHPRLGLMDLIDPSNVLAFTIGYSGSKGNHSWGVDLWYFEADEVDPELDGDLVGHDFLVAGHGLDDHIGNELDLWYNYQYSKNLSAQFAVGYFDAGDLIDDIHNCDDSADCDPRDSDTFGDVISTDAALRVYANLLLRF